MAKVYPLSDDELGKLSRQAARAKAVEWKEKAIAELADAGNRLDWNVGPVIESFTDVKWDNGEKMWYFEVRHTAAGYMNFGTPRHPITPNQADALHFITDDGEEVFTTFVDHPGMPAVMFIEKSRERIIASREDVERRIDL